MYVKLLVFTVAMAVVLERAYAPPGQVAPHAKGKPRGPPQKCTCYLCCKPGGAANTDTCEYPGSAQYFQYYCNGCTRMADCKSDPWYVTLIGVLGG